MEEQQNEIKTKALSVNEILEILAEIRFDEKTKENNTKTEDPS